MAERTDRPSTADLAYGKKDDARPDGNTSAVREEQGNVDGRQGQGMTAQQETNTALFREDDTRNYQERWNSIQNAFVDKPQESVKEADVLVAEVMQNLAQKFAQEREKLEKQWTSGSDVSTEDFRVALQHYRSFFQRLLSA